MTTEAVNDITEVDAAELPLSCPRPNAPLWNMHPRVFLDIATTGHAKCPYCGAEYRLKGEPPKH
ncbi:zinc-finger domain-containing protein [Pigmentiphaga sp.]|jgi:Uncharacterized protein conserved in bacteria|uniref:zinc-finger domain-containing protein n=1 Tax=Pigmentiphaga sp. TaxID=1977564 RepID=UPI0025D91C81|nr:zinc-finger domain-containing protein [Pigmentiphaga sp.]MBX6318670.1 zinc-finger domain-containing protein [Pigmentiphaga sp.]